MCVEERQLAEAAASLTVEDFRFLEENDMLPSPPPQAGKEAASENSAHTEGAPAAEESSQDNSSEKKGKRRKVEHEWPQVGAVLGADYRGTRYEAEVIEVPRYKSGKAIRILTGPAAGEVERSMSGAMLTATEAQREENDLARKGVSNGWEFWKVKDPEPGNSAD